MAGDPPGPGGIEGFGFERLDPLAGLELVGGMEKEDSGIDRDNRFRTRQYFYVTIGAYQIDI
jgi:hypothetical protein